MPTLAQSQIEMYARSAGLEPADKWAAIAMAESSGRTDVVNSIGCVGLWQINQPVHVKSHPQWTVKYLQDPLNNARAAKTIAGSQGLSAWEAYTGPDGKGSDGPWKNYYKGSDSSPGVSGAVGAAIDFGGSTIADATGLTGIQDIATNVSAAGKWISTPYNWVRIGYVIGGGVLLFVGVGLIVNSTILNSAAGKAVTGALPTKQVTNAVKGIRKK